MPCGIKCLSRGLQVRPTALWGCSRGWHDRSCSRLAWSLQEAVIAVLHLMQHLLLRGLVHRVQHGDLMHEQVPLAL